MTKFSVIIPTFNEEQKIQHCIKSIHESVADVEVIVVDGGSLDGTISIAEQEGAVVCRSDLGRGKQSNAGVGIASGDVLLILHADTLLPPNAFELLQVSFQDVNVQIGTFRLGFDVQHPILRLYTLFTRCDSVFTRFGDQCIVLRRSFFEIIGGFPEWPLFEDVRMLQNARKRTHIFSFPAQVTTSARRFLKHGIIWQQLRNAWYLTLYLLGFSPVRLAMKYERGSNNQTGAVSSPMLSRELPGASHTKT